MNSTGGNLCPKCQKRVYFAEEVIAMAHHWHKACFRCTNSDCGRGLDSLTFSDHEGVPYCKHCYGKLFGPKGYGYGQGAGTLSMDGGHSHNGPVTSNISTYHKAQVAPLFERNGEISNGSLRSSPGGKGSGVTKTATGTELCRRCNKPVYMAERKMGAGSAWHAMTCFTCSECNKKLESTTMCEREGEIYCKTCYGRNFGPKGYGFGIGAGTLQMQQ